MIMGKRHRYFCSTHDIDQPAHALRYIIAVLKRLPLTESEPRPFLDIRDPVSVPANLRAKP